MEEPIENNTQEREDDLLTEQQDIFSYYRRLRSNLFSDTEVVYETKLTPELFDLKLQQLSQDKKQSEFENFVLVLAAEDDRYTLLNLRDVSALRQQREEMAAQLEEAQAASQSKTEFLSRMSHEIRTPINGITGLMALTRTRLGGSNPAAEEYLTRAEDLSQHLLSVINDILDLSRIEAGKIELEQKSFDLYALGDQLRSMFQKTVEAKGLRFNLEFKNFTARYVVGDQLRITQVLVNFLSNAVKFTSQGEISVTFRQMMLSDDTVSFMVAVKDTGTGMAPKFINSIFRPFQQEDASIAKRFGGSGLGMAITDQLVRLMGGEIVVDIMP